MCNNLTPRSLSSRRDAVAVSSMTSKLRLVVRSVSPDTWENEADRTTWATETKVSLNSLVRKTLPHFFFLSKKKWEGPGRGSAVDIAW